MPLDGTQVTAVLIGTGKVRHHPEFAEVPEVYTNISRLRSALLREDVLGVPSDNIKILIDRERGELLRELRDALSQPREMLILYYCGHGAIHESGKGLVLTVADSTQHLIDHTSLHFSSIREVVESSTRATRRVCLLDCCFAGQAIPPVLSDVPNLLAAAIGEVSTAEGTFAIAAAGAYETARRGLHMTPFTEAVVKTLEEGVVDGPATLNVLEFYESLRKRLPEDVRPRRSELTSGSSFEFIKNVRKPAQRAVASAPLIDAARRFGNKLFIGGIDRQLDYLQMAQSLQGDLRSGCLSDLRYHYLGHLGAKSWIELSGHEAYGHESEESLRALRKPIRAAVAERANQSQRSISVVGLGCGSGVVDRFLMQSIKAGTGTAVSAYFPVDISVALLQTAMRQVVQAGDLNQVVVLPIVADLRRLQNVTAIWRQSQDIEIFTLLGCTVGNFRKESEVLSPIAGAMQAEDLLLMDVRCYAGDALDDAASVALVSRFDHVLNKTFSAGPLVSSLGHAVKHESITVRLLEPPSSRISEYSEIRGTRSVVTELALDDDVRQRLDIDPGPQSLALSWSNVYNESAFFARLAEYGFELLARHPTSVATGAVQTVSMLLRGPRRDRDDDEQVRRKPVQPPINPAAS